MRAALVIALLASGCGRLGFGGSTDSDGSVPGDVTAGSEAPDANLGPIVVFPMDNDPQVTQTLVAEPGMYSRACATTCPTLVQGRIDNGYEFFNGPIQRIPHGELISTAAPFSVSFWFLVPPTATNFMAMVARPIDSTMFTGNVLSMWIGTDGSTACEVAVSGVSTARGTTGIDVRDNMWHHVAYTWDGSNGRCFHNGVETGILPGPLDDGLENVVFIGGDVDPLPGGEIPFTGSLDDLRFYDRWLSQAEITALQTP